MVWNRKLQIWTCAELHKIQKRKFFLEQILTDPATDTTIYSFNKIIPLLTSNNPNTIELLGCKPEHYFYLSDIGKELLDNRKIFLSKICIHTFGGYSSQQLRRMENKSARQTSQTHREEYILKTDIFRMRTAISTYTLTCLRRKITTAKSLWMFI